MKPGLIYRTATAHALFSVFFEADVSDKIHPVLLSNLQSLIV